MTAKEYIRRYIHLKMQSGEWKPGDKILSENQLAMKFNCSRLTARQALKPFVYSGTLMALKGKGYIVSKENVEFSLRSQTELHGITKSKLEVIEPTEQILEELDLKDNDRHVLFIKTYIKGNVTVSMQLTALNKDTFWEFDPKAFEKSITTELSHQGVIIKSNIVNIEFAKTKTLDSVAKDLNWGKDYLIERISSYTENDWIEKTIRMTNKDLFKITFAKFRNY